MCVGPSTSMSGLQVCVCCELFHLDLKRSKIPYLILIWFVWTPVRRTGNFSSDGNFHLFLFYFGIVLVIYNNVQLNIELRILWCDKLCCRWFSGGIQSVRTCSCEPFVTHNITFLTRIIVVTTPLFCRSSSYNFFWNIWIHLTLRKIANWMSKNCQKLDIFFKKIDKNCHFFNKIAIGIFFFFNFKFLAIFWH